MTQEIVLSREQVRMIDRLAVERFGIPSIVLMENAGRSCADILLSLGVCPSGPVCICCGKGNNGGDGFVMARHLAAAGVPVEILVFFDEDQLSEDAAFNFRILNQMEGPIHRLTIPDDLLQLRRHFTHASWIVDALLGTGFQGTLREPYNTIAREMNDSGRPILSIDLPSGLDCDLGTVEKVAVRATATATLVAAKPGFRSRVGQKHCGQIHIGSIGIPQNLITSVHPVGDFQESP
ncbi:MAG TPA: NAD(P)H-hydrate epimerase [Planctomicrobium sp.]|nr:NAD(P)H-hydrate epimerase [Planctomicrobium sp.]